MFFIFSGGSNYNSVGLDLKRHIEEQSMGSPSSTGENQDSLSQEPEVKRTRHEYDTE